MRRLCTVLLLLALSTAAAQAQQQPAEGGAHLVDRFGEIQLSDLKARLDNFAVELQNNPAATGLIAAYAAKHKFPGWPARRVRMMQSYLISTRGLDRSRFSVVNAGLRAETEFELWVVPPGVEPPAKPFDISLLMSGEKTALPFDRFVVMERGDQWQTEDGDPHPDDAYLYQYLAEMLRSDPGLRACIIGYTSRRGSRAAAKRIAARAKLAMARSHAIDITRVTALGGGRREYKTIELWLVPPGAPLPRPTPSDRTRRLRRR